MNLKTFILRGSSMDSSKSPQPDARTQKSPDSPIKERDLEDGSIRRDKILVSLHAIPYYRCCLLTTSNGR